MNYRDFQARNVSWPGVSRYFSWHGAFVSRWPCMIIIACLLMSVTLMTMYYTIMEKESDSKKLFTPKNARSFEDRDVYEELYGIPPSQAQSRYKKVHTMPEWLLSDTDTGYEKR